MWMDGTIEENYRYKVRIHDSTNKFCLGDSRISDIEVIDESGEVIILFEGFGDPRWVVEPSDQLETFLLGKILGLYE
ncbi:hypothetical protein [Carnobacterium divergens]|uniref:hypothetical protein n=1 Tax=Carnobacterium divergens TaxID=2748 RepID=UPI00288FBA39|nr:hypothetical protein [Carnobacterium divergens]MDT2010804.1 hypothetical protein [Carnobacterium divergens]